KVGHVPKSGYLHDLGETMDVGSHLTVRYRKVLYRGTKTQKGWVEESRCLRITPNGFVLAAEGIGVFDRVPGKLKDQKEGPTQFAPNAFLAKDTLISFKDTDKVTHGDYFELVQGGWVKVDATSVAEYEGNIEPVYGSIVTPRSVVKKGETIGYAGPYL